MNKRILTSVLSVVTAFGGFAIAQQPAPKDPAKPAAPAKPAPKPKPVAPLPEYTGLNPKTMAPTAGTADNTAPEGFVAAFNGKDLTGWVGLLKAPNDNPIKRAALSAEDRAKATAEAEANKIANWKVEDGALVFSGKGRSLCTANQYGNFEMWVTWKIKEAGDSGIYLRGSPQVQIWDTNLKNGAHVGSGGFYNNQKNPAIPLKKADKPVGEWNTFFIRMVGEKATVYLNGELVVDNVTLENYWDRTQPIFAKEQIELQNHGNTLWFKNIYIKELPDSAAK
ncbi:3-keto-disaccharide hydrolase [Humisphaera borealis]|uniref:3-keto-disaccharide hydrolase n=1 Tax=Humisphaera borealis TaxID=2807512 RepID=UPI0019D28D2C|nr:DUF1080 domain-containing protein [Humisphaera borealis]